MAGENSPEGDDHAGDVHDNREPRRGEDVRVDDVRVDGLSGATVVIAGHRQQRPNLPHQSCPFCPGGREAPEPYDVRWFANRWPAMAGERCEVLLYTPEHDASLPDLGAARVRKVVDLWAGRSEALGARADVDYVLIFENRGREVGATIDHPHGQLYAFTGVPPVPVREAAQPSAPAALNGARADARCVVGIDGWHAWVPEAPVYPVEVLIAPHEPVPDLPSLDGAGRDGLAATIVDVLARLDNYADEAVPYLLIVHQRPFDGRPWPVRLHLHVQSPWRSAGALRYIAAGELGSGVYFNPVVPEELADGLRHASTVPRRRKEAP